MNSEDIIDKVLRNVPLTQEEKDWWSANNESSPAKEDLTFLKELKAPLAVANKKMLKEELISFERKYQVQEEKIEKKTKVFSLQRWMSIAAVGLVLISSLFIFRNSQNADPFEHYFEPYPSILNPIVKGSQGNVILSEQITQAYQNENFNLVIQLMSKDVENDTLSFYHANALLATNQTQEALTIFAKLEDTDNRFSQEAAWYGSLSLLKLDRMEAAKNQLQSIIKDQQHPYFLEASNLLEKIQ